MAGRPKKDEFSDMDPELKEQLEGMDDTEVRRKVSEFALLRQAQKEMMKEDPEVIEATENLKLAKGPYNEAIKGAELNIKFAKQLLEARGRL